MVDAPASGAGDRKVVEVRVLSWAPALRQALAIAEKWQNMDHSYSSDATKRRYKSAKLEPWLWVSLWNTFAA